jgi:SAM-dependent methyltransferase
MTVSDLRCSICGATALEEVVEYRQLPRVSSDCKPIAAGGALLACTFCGGIQKAATPEFLADIGRIYDAYDVYYQGGGLEQIVFDSVSGGGMRRSKLLSGRLADSGLLTARGQAIDLGCGNGGFLRALSERLPDWEFRGLELDDRHLATLKTIPNFVELRHEDVKAISGQFDFISMIHALEHFLDPFETLRALRKNITPGGLIYIQIPNVQENPFDLLIADHVSHFSAGSLRAILARAGYDIVSLSTDWVKKELSVLARPSDRTAAAALPYHPLSLARDNIAWLASTLQLARDTAAGPRFGLFGTSIAATWLSGALGDRIEFYIDEDAGRQGRRFFDKPVYGLTEAPRDATIFVGLAPVIGTVLADRLRSHGFNVVMPAMLSAQ